MISDRVGQCYTHAIPEFVTGDLLDLGCGQVPFYAAYRQHVDSVTCVDWPGSPHDVQFADVLCDINEPLPIEGHSFDTIICSDVLEHLHNPSGLLGEVRRVLRPGGRVLLNVPFMYGIHEAPFDYFRYTRFALGHLAINNGLCVREIQELGGLGDVACDLSAKLLSGVPLIGQTAAAVTQCAWIGLTRLRVLRGLDQRTADYFPLGYFAVLVHSESVDPLGPHAAHHKISVS